VSGSDRVGDLGRVGDVQWQDQRLLFVILCPSVVLLDPPRRQYHLITLRQNRLGIRPAEARGPSRDQPSPHRCTPLARHGVIAATPAATVMRSGSSTIG
jgi:hypothetical protein